MKRLRPLVLALLAASLFACGGGESGPDRRSSPKGSTKRTEPAKTPTLALGRQLFIDRCSQCHGEEGEGRVGIAPRLTSKTFFEAVSNENLADSIRGGRPGTTMPAWNVSDSELSSMIAYLRTLVPHKRVSLDESPLKGDPTKGAEIFRTICANCHGRNGAGYQEAGSGTGIGRKAFLAVFSNGFLRHVIKHGKSQTGMRAFEKDNPSAIADLSDDDVENVIAHLRHNAW